MTKDNIYRSCDSTDIRRYISHALKFKATGNVDNAARSLRIAEKILQAAIRKLEGGDMDYFYNTF